MILVEVGAVRRSLGKVGPWRGPLRAVLAIALVLVAALAERIALREHRRAVR